LISIGACSRGKKSKEVKIITPQGQKEIRRLESRIKPESPITFIRFSDGEMDILRNHKAVIADKITYARGHTFESNFPAFDFKTFLPEKNSDVRSDLIESAMYRSDRYYIGIPTAHNNAIADREFMLRLHGGYDAQVTFSDLFMNSNYLYARNNFFPSIIKKFKKLYVLCNYRSKLNGILANGEAIKIGDNFFSNYTKTLSEVEEKVYALKKNSLLLCSASSLSNIVAYKTQFDRPDITIVDIGTALNDYLSLENTTRAYHSLLKNDTNKELIQNIRYRLSSGYRLRW